MSQVILENDRDQVVPIQRPKSNESRLWDIVLGHFNYHMLLVAHDLGLFPLLAQKPQTLEEIATALKLAHRATQAMLTACGSMELVQVDRGHYRLTQLAQDYLLATSPTYFGGFLTMVTANHQVNSYPSLQKAIRPIHPRSTPMASCFNRMRSKRHWHVLLPWRCMGIVWARLWPGQRSLICLIPLPTGLVVKNGSKSRVLMDSGMPGPLSAI